MWLNLLNVVRWYLTYCINYQLLVDGVGRTMALAVIGSLDIYCPEACRQLQPLTL
jgi:hypothetical protein